MKSPNHTTLLNTQLLHHFRLTTNMKKLFFVLLILFFNLPLFAQVQIGQDIDGETAGDYSGFSVSMPDANTVGIGARLNSGNGLYAGHTRVYSWNGNSWIQKGQDIDGEAAGDWSGYSISMPDINTVAIGAVSNGFNSTGHVRIYSWNGFSWIQKGADINGEAPYNDSGYSVSMPDSNTVAIGAPGNDGNGVRSGHVRIYIWNGNSWIQKGGDIDGEAAYDWSGYSVSMPDINTVAIGAFYNDGNGQRAGHARIYSWTGNTWIQKGQDLDGEATNDDSGTSVSMPDANTVAIGAPGNDNNNGTNSGHTRVYTWNGTIWVQKGQDIDGEAVGDNSGTAVHMPDSNTVAIGSTLNGGKGHVRIFFWNGSNWIQKGIDIDGEAVGDNSGNSLSMSDANAIAIGAYRNSGGGMDAGHVRVYKLSGIHGKVFQDFNQNCVKDSLDIGFNNIRLTISSGNQVIQVPNGGNWLLDSLPAGTYTITADTTNSNWQLTCPATQTFTVVQPDSLTHAADFGYVSTNPCPQPEVSIHAPFLRPGFSNQKVYLQACNEALGTDVMDSAYVVVELDPLLTVDNASTSYTALGTNRFKVYLSDSLFPGQCVNFWLDCTLSTNAVLGQTLCMQADLYPVDSCVLDSVPGVVAIPCSTAYDNSHLEVWGSCANDTIDFVVKNTGTGNMSCSSEVNIYLDGYLNAVDTVQLNAGDSMVYQLNGNGYTYRLEVDQHPLHPGNSNPNATVELCGNANNWTPNLVNIFPMDDADPVRDIYCGEVRGSYDPNDKTGFPLGRGVAHEVLANQPLEYRIRFQNTGTDTAFRVVIRDTLPEELNIFTVRSGVASHDYDFRMYGPRVLEWTFNNIMLPDSNVNEPASHGFVKFKVNQVPNLPLGTVINNRVGIYFDFNAPIITNLTEHTIGEPQILNVQTFEEDKKQLNWRAYPNPTTGQITLDLERTQQQIQLELFDLQGRLLRSQSFSQQSQISWQLGDQPAGLYILRVSTEKGQANLKLVIQ